MVSCLKFYTNILVTGTTQLFYICINTDIQSHFTDFLSARSLNMAPRSQLEITTSSVIRLVKEEASYHNELVEQEKRIQKLEGAQGGDDENQEYLLKQEVC